MECEINEMKSVVINEAHHCFEPHTKSVSNVISTRLAPMVGKITGGHHCG